MASHTSVTNLNIHEKMEGGHRLTAEEMDDIRQKNIAYQYLCHLEEAKKWIEACIEEDLPDTEKLEEEFRHGVYLAKLGNFFAPDSVPSKKIFDKDLTRYHYYGLHFRHTDNINYFLKALKDIKLPKIFYPETTDIYDRKNIPRVVFCVHALSLYLFRLGIAPQIQNLYGKIKFSDEVMAAMMQELSKFGCQLPQFGKIGGILANELPVDEAALHAAIIAINDALQKQDLKELKDTLLNPNSHLNNVTIENMASYNNYLSDAQMDKKTIALNKSREENYISDAYDELLTQAEIQGFVNHANLFLAVEEVEKALSQNNPSNLLTSLSSSVLALKGLNLLLSEEYLKALKEEMMGRRDQSFNQSLMECILSKSCIQGIVKRVNEQAENKMLESDKLKRLNSTLAGDSPSDTLSALHDLQDNLGPVLDNAAPLYHEELSAMRQEAQVDLTMPEVSSGVGFLTALGNINIALDGGIEDRVWHYLSDAHAHIQDLDEFHRRDYFGELSHLRRSKVNSEDLYTFLSHMEIQEIVDIVNEHRRNDERKTAEVKYVNEAFMADDCPALLAAIKAPFFELKRVCLEDAQRLMLFLKMRGAENLEKPYGSAYLQLEDIVDAVEEMIDERSRIHRLGDFLNVINTYAHLGDVEEVAVILREFNSTGYYIRDDIVEAVSQDIIRRFELPEEEHCEEKWFTHQWEDGTTVYIDRKSHFTWYPPTPSVDSLETDSDCVPHPLIDMPMVHSLIEAVTKRQTNNQLIENMAIRLQAVCRGFLVRKRVRVQRKSALKIQSWWRMARVRRSYVMYREALRLWEFQIIKIQRAFRAWRGRRRIQNVADRFRGMEHKVVVIQRAWRQYKARLDLQSLTQCRNPPLGVVRKFVHLLQVSHFDFDEELRLQRVKSDVVKTIRRTQTLESEIDEYDVKIGLLVHNRITLQDVIRPVADKENFNPNKAGHDSGTKKNKKSAKEADKAASTRSHKGLKALTKESRERLLGYQHLFYLLQTQPHYLASLIFALPIGRTTKFIENVIFTLYNYGANDRDNFLLLKLMKTALEEEIRSKVLRLSDVVSGNPLVLKMIVSFNRNGTGQTSLRDMLAPLVETVINDPNLQINTNPVEIYKTWVNQLEMTSGQASGLPYVVSQEHALQCPEVQKRLMKAVSSLKEATDRFCTHITSSRHLIPYAMQYMAKVMKAALHNRFPHVQDKDILKVVGHLIYYRYINSAIVAPDAFDIIPNAPDKKLTNEQRRNLASIAKVLQFAAAKKGFGEEASHLMGLNPFIVEYHERFKALFRECCLVEEPEEVYNVNQYSEATIIIKPTVYITLQEIVLTHELLLDNEENIAPDLKDPLHELLRDLGERPSILTLIGEPQVAEGSNTLASVGRTEVCLALSSKFDLNNSCEGQSEAKDSNQKLFFKTKQLLVDLLQCIEGDSVEALTTGPTLPHQERNYHSIVATRARHEHKAKLNDTGLNRSNSFLGDARVNLSEVKTKLKHNLRRLENRSLAVRADDYQTLLNAIARDIVDQRHHRVSRRNELQKLVMTLKKLEDKETFYREQLNSYTTYLDTCLVNLASRNKNVHQQALSTKSGKASKSKLSLRYTGARLHERGVILEIEDLPPSQFKNVLFEITPTATSGVFQVQVKFMGVAMEVVPLDIQGLLQLQYEGVSVKQMFGKAKVNVNLLLHLLNSKFYSKK